MTDIDTTEPAPLNQREMNQFITLAALPTLERALERLRWLEAELAALKKADPLAEMWCALAEHQPFADRDGHGESWAKMCEDRTEAAAEEAYRARQWSSHVAAAAYNAWWAAQQNAAVRRLSKDAVAWAANSIDAIRRAKEAKR